jgi:hypothetical protein
MGDHVHVHMDESMPQLKRAITSLESLSARPISMVDLEEHGLDKHFQKILEPGHHFFLNRADMELVCAVRIQYVPYLLALLVVNGLNRPWSDILQQHQTFLALQQVMSITEFTPPITSNRVSVVASRRES